MQSVDVADLDQMIEEFSKKNQNPKQANDFLLNDIGISPLKPMEIQRLSNNEIEADRLIHELESEEKENEPLTQLEAPSNCIEGENLELFDTDDFMDAMDNFDNIDLMDVAEDIVITSEPVDVNDIFGDTQSTRPSTSLDNTQ